MRKIMVFILCVFSCMGYVLSEEQRIANSIPGKMVFSSERTNDGKQYVYLLENGKLENLGFESNCAKFSPNGKLIATICRSDGKNYDEAYIYDLGKRKIKAKYIPKFTQYYDIDWTKDGKYLIYGVKEPLDTEKKFYNTYLIRMNVKNGKEEILKKYEHVDFGYDIWNIHVSPDNKRMVVIIGNGFVRDNPGTVERLHIMDIDGTNDRALWEVGRPLGWYPDGKHILMHTNNDNKGNRINDQEGRLYKLNVDTLATEVVEETITTTYAVERLTRDGKFIYSSRYFFNPYFNYSIVFSPTGPRNDEAMVTYHVPYTYHGETKYSEDSAPDWWYE